MKAAHLAAATSLLLAALAAPGASAEQAWVRGAPLNLRSGAGLDQPVLGSVAPGERLEVIASAGEWARVKRADGTQGWLAASYLAREAPPAARIAELEGEAARLREELASAARSADAMRQDSDDAARAESERQAELQRMRHENDVLRSGARWPEWITGALILATGMAFGAVLRGVSGRRRQTRLKL
jgi:uncharacterized protein YgiM (DUF1202 family)